LGHYTHGVAISNHRLVSFANDQVTFRWGGSAHNNEHKLMTLALDEFLRRFLLHLLPKGVRNERRAA
jgi:Putative transposase